MFDKNNNKTAGKKNWSVIGKKNLEPFKNYKFLGLPDLAFLMSLSCYMTHDFFPNYVNAIIEDSGKAMVVPRRMIHWSDILSLLDHLHVYLLP